MSNRTAAFFWLALAAFFALTTLGTLAFGGYAAWHSHGNLQLVEVRMEKDQAELDRFKKRPLGRDDLPKMQALEKNLEDAMTEANEARQNRFYGFIILLCSVVPAAMTLPFFTMFLVKLLKARAAARKALQAEHDESDEEEVESSAMPKSDTAPDMKIS